MQAEKCGNTYVRTRDRTYTLGVTGYRTQHAAHASMHACMQTGRLSSDGCVRACDAGDVYAQCSAHAPSSRCGDHLSHLVVVHDCVGPNNRNRLPRYITGPDYDRTKYFHRHTPTTQPEVPPRSHTAATLLPPAPSHPQAPHCTVPRLWSQQDTSE